MEKFDESTLFLTNRNGFPLDDETWKKMWKFALHQYPNALDKLHEVQSKAAKELKEVKTPTPPLTFPSGISIANKVLAVQKYMNELQYNHTGTQFFEIKKYRSFSGLMDDAKLMIKESLPIKCLEAVVLGIYLTNKIDDLTRFSIGFKSSFEGRTHRHVVLGLYSRGHFGALGVSRRQDLMYKPLAYKSLTDLILDYQAGYSRYWHSLKSVKIGSVIGHNPHSFEPLPWKGVTVFPSSQTREELSGVLEKFSKLLRHNVSFTYRLPSQESRMTRSASLPSLQRMQQQQQQQQQQQSSRGASKMLIRV